MANKNGIRTDKFTSKAGDFTLVKPGKSSSKPSSSGSKSGTKKK